MLQTSSSYDIIDNQTICNDKRTELDTGYYRSLITTHSEGCDEISISNYGPYDIFCLETRLYPIVYDLLNRNIVLTFHTVYENNRMELKISINFPLNKITLNSVLSDSEHKFLNDQIKRITATEIGYCLIDKYELYLSSGKTYPINWFYIMLQYVNIPNAFYRENGIYLTLDEKSEYKESYNIVCNNVLEQIEEFYQNGTVYGAQSISNTWDLELISDNLYIPRWRDNRFASHLVEFLLAKIQGDPHIMIEISTNLSVRHHIASVLSEKGITMVFEGDYVKIPANTIEKEQKMAALVKFASFQSKNDRKERAMIQNLSNLSDVYSFIEETTKIIPDTNCIGYQVTNMEKPYVFSCLVNSSNNKNSDKLITKIRDNVTLLQNMKQNMEQEIKQIETS